MSGADKSQLKSFKSPLVIQPFVFPPVLGLFLFLTHPLYIPSCIAHVSPPTMCRIQVDTNDFIFNLTVELGSSHHGPDFEGQKDDPYPK